MTLKEGTQFKEEKDFWGIKGLTKITYGKGLLDALKYKGKKFNLDDVKDALINEAEITESEIDSFARQNPEMVITFLDVLDEEGLYYIGEVGDSSAFSDDDDDDYLEDDALEDYYNI